METIKVGMTRTDLLKVFTEEGGLSSRESRTYGYRECRYFKVDVEFRSVERPGGDEFGRDVIVKISRPYVHRMVVD
jgi:hypothetical protein